jgi:hypothetical protein
MTTELKPKSDVTKRRSNYLGADSLCDSRKAGGQCLNCQFNSKRCCWDRTEPNVRDIFELYWGFSNSSEVEK